MGKELFKRMDKEKGTQEEGDSSPSNFLNEGHELIQSSTERSETILYVKGLIMKRPREMGPLQYSSCMHRIPLTLVKEKPEAYIPHLVSIGPFHRNRPHLQFMDSRKACYLDNFLSSNPERVLEDYIEAMIDLEERVRGSYQEAEKDELKIDKKSFVMMLVVDGCFILQLLLSQNHEIMSFRKWGFVVSLDLQLLENQLPFSVLEKLYQVFMDRSGPDGIYSNATLSFSPQLRGILGLTIEGHIRKDSYVWRILELLVGKNVNSYCCVEFRTPSHLLDFLRQILIPNDSYNWQENDSRKEEDSYVRACIPCAKDLRRANVKFVRNKNPTSLLDIKYNITEGVLEIPGLRIDCGTEMIIRNLIAYEQQIDDYSFITEYAAFLDGLIDSSTDVELLQKSGIIEIILGDPNDVSRLFNNLLKDVAVPVYNKTAGIRRQVAQFCKKKRNKRMAILKLDYVNNPWALISVVAAIILLTTAVVQTLFTILSYFHS